MKKGVTLKGIVYKSFFCVDNIVCVLIMVVVTWVCTGFKSTTLKKKRSACKNQWLQIRSIFVVIQLLSCVWLFATPWTAACQASMSFIISCSLLRLMSIEPVMPSNHLILCHPLLLPSIFPRIKGNHITTWCELVLHIRWPKYWSFSVSPSNEY